MKRIYKARMQVEDEMMFHVLFCCMKLRQLFAILVFLLAEKFNNEEPYATSAPSPLCQHAAETAPQQDEITPVLEDDILADLWMSFEQRTQQQIEPRPGVDLREAVTDLLTLERRNKIDFKGCDLNKLIALRQIARQRVR